MIGNIHHGRLANLLVQVEVDQVAGDQFADEIGAPLHDRHPQQGRVGPRIPLLIMNQLVSHDAGSLLDRFENGPVPAAQLAALREGSRSEA